MGLTRDQAIAQVNKLYSRLAGRRSEIDRLERYFKGKQPLAYATDEWRKLHGQRYRNFSDNWCGVVGSTPAERMEVIGFRLTDQLSDPRTDDEKQLAYDWEINDLPMQSSQGFVTTSVCKRSAVLVWGDDNDEPVATWEHPSQVIVDYDPCNARVRRFALKAWVEGDQELATLYTPDEVWKFQRPHVMATVSNGRTESGLYITADLGSTGILGGHWEPRQPDDDDTWPIDNPMGLVPVVEFLNRPLLGSDPLSDIDGTVAMQDAVNLLWAYLFVAADFASMPARVVLGQEPPKIPVLDENGQKIGERPVDQEQLTRGRMLWLTGQETKVDQWEAATLSVFTDVVEIAIRHIAAQTRTPIYLIHGELGNVNGETLTGLDAPLVSKVGENHKFCRAPLQETYRLMALARGNSGVADACRTGTVLWANPATRSEAQVSDAALKDRQIGWPFQSILERRYGLSGPEIDRIMELRKAEQTDPLVEKILQNDTAAAGAGSGGMDSTGGMMGGAGSG